MPLSMLFIHSFLSGVALIFFETTANTMFLTDFGTSELPYVYILTAFVSVVAGFGYTKLEQRLDIKMLLKITLGFVLFIVVSFFILIRISDNSAASMAIMVFKDVVWMFVALEFGILSGIIFNIRQGKRLFGILMSGEILAGIIGGLSVGFILNFIDTKSLLLISIIALGLSTLLLLEIIAKFSARFENASSEEEHHGSTISLQKILSNNYYLLFFAVSIVAFFVFYFIDYIFYYSVEERFSTEKELASFFGLFFALLNIVNLASSLFISGKMLSRFGVLFGLVVIPLIALAGTASLIVIALTSLGFAFFVVVALKLLDEVADTSILNPTFKIIYQSIPIKYRMKVIALRETIIEPLAMGVAGVILLGLTQLDNINIIYYLLVGLAVVWLVLSNILKEKYVVSLKEILSKREALEDDIFLDSVAQNLFLENLKSEDEIEVIYSLDSLIKMKYADIDTIIVELIHHPSKRVRIYLLDLLSHKEIDHLVEILEERIEQEEDSEVLHKLFNVYCKVASIDAIELVSEYLHDEDPLVQEGAIIAMLQYSGVDGILVAGQVLNELFESSKKEQNLLALNILSKMTIPSFYGPLEKALDSNDDDLKRIAITTVGNLGIKKFIPYLLENLEQTPYRNLRAISLSKFGAKIFDHLASYFEHTDDLDVRLALVRVFANMRTRQAHTYLLSYTNEPLLFDEIINRLFDYDFICNDESKIIELLSISVHYALYCMMILECLDKTNYPNSYIVVEEIKNQKIYSIFFILGFVYSKSLMIRSKVNYFDKDTNKQAYAIEVVDNVISNKIKEIILPTLEKLSLDKKLSQYSDAFINKSQSQEEFIERVLSDKNIFTILKLSVLYEIGLNRDNLYKEHIKKLEDDSNGDIAQTAQWAMNELTKG
ncbi:MAG: MFS transporter [Campylobacterales bacterium]|nr:MFS transporter [Campylobacterales bacterium]